MENLNNTMARLDNENKVVLSNHTSRFQADESFANERKLKSEIDQLQFENRQKNAHIDDLKA